jgi:hypothetical protein
LKPLRVSRGTIERSDFDFRFLEIDHGKVGKSSFKHSSGAGH